MDCQDWTPVTVGRRNVSRTPGSHNSYPQKSASAITQRSLEQEEIPKLKKRLSIETRQLLTNKRIERTLKQTELDRNCAFPSGTIRDFESGKAVPTPTQLNILNKTLGISLKFESNQ